MKPCAYFLSLLLLVLFSAQEVRAEPADSLQKGLDAFHAGEFEQSRRAFADALREHGPSAQLYYNHGLALQKSGDDGGAVLAYLRALALDPGQMQARSALDALAAEKKLAVPEPGLADGIIRWAGAGTAWTLGAVAGWIGLLAAGTAFFRRQNRLPWVLGAVLFLGTSGALLGVAATADPLLVSQSLGVIQGKNSVALRANPVEAAGALTNLPPGTVVEVLSERTPWVYVAVPGGKNGWLSRTDLALVVPGPDAQAPET
jgi:hypothetical protein